MSKAHKVNVGPVGYETDPARAMRVFELGCSGVIVDGAVPQDVRAELENFRFPGPEGHKIKLHDTLEGLKWDLSDRLPDLTKEWLVAQLHRVQEAGLRPLLQRERQVMHQAMVVWFRQVLARTWHIDNQERVEWPDVHLHVHGEGMTVAVPEKDAIDVCVGSDFQFVANPGPARDRDPIGAADAALQDKGFKLVSLQPGQMLVFRDDCLHRSARGDANKMKLRAGML